LLQKILKGTDVKEKWSKIIPLVAVALILLSNTLFSQIGTRFPSEKRVIKDPVTGTLLTFLTSKPAGDSKIYQTHPQWTSDGKWLIFRSNRVRGEAMAVNESSGVIVQVSEGGFTGMLCVAWKSLKLYMMRYAGIVAQPARGGAMQVVEVDLASLFADSESGKLKPADIYQRVCGTIPAELGAGGDMALDANEDRVYFRVGRQEAAKHLPQDAKIESNFGPRKMGSGPAGLMSMNITTGELKYIASVPFQIGHVQSNPWAPGEIVFCWETGGKAPQRTWTVMADGTGLRPLYPESEYEWVTHEAVIARDEVAIAIMGHRQVGTPERPSDPANPGQEAAWGPSGTREKPTGLGIVNLRTREMAIVGQTPSGSGLWHVNGSEDGRWAVGDDFSRSIYLIDRHSHEMTLLSTGHKTTAADHPHPSFSPDGTRIEIQSAMLSQDGRSMNICVMPVPEAWLNRKYDSPGK
jgi:oligogalacturonide lyase